MADEEEKQEEKTTIKFSGTERSILDRLSSNLEVLAAAVDRLTQQVMTLAERT